MMFQQQVLISLIGATVGGLIGFLFAYRMALIQRRWDLEKAASEAKRRRIEAIHVHTEAIRIPLERIRVQIRSDYQLQEYFNSASEIPVLLQIGQAVHALKHPALIKAFENAKPQFHIYAQSPNSKAAGVECLKRIEEILGVLATYPVNGGTENAGP
jgi:hypothetical protein